ncbi:PREDICTED: uncharacterized protein LOC107353552 [Acropora digitifera]|uniref:uncharacterized protein LOC107353552 n=1 Tax=Acropora digitifera TaxID=70779 RepID=UPI00077ACAC3|nr:PREDICTED: uncharacterized protein LOC107353552 [Acropora digitifera]
MKTSEMELTVIFQGDDDSEELIYSGGTRKTWSWLPSKARGLFCRDEHQDEEEESTWKKAGFIPRKGFGTAIPFREEGQVTFHEGRERRIYTKEKGWREKNCQITNVTTEEDCGVRAKEDEKVEKYQDLAREVRRMWTLKVWMYIAPLVGCAE